MPLIPSFRLLLTCLLLALPASAQMPEPVAPLPPPATLQVANGYLVVHVPSEGVTVVGEPAGEGASDTGWATWAQRGQLLWRGEMTDSLGRRYNIRILPGYVAPTDYAREGWSDAGGDLAEYGQRGTWMTMGHDMRHAFKWGWKSSLWEFGLKGTKNAWVGNFDKAHTRTSRRTFGWPLAYPWAFIASAFESALRLPLGVAGAAVGTVTAAGIIPVVETAWPAAKALGNASVNGLALPVVAWTWQTVAAPPAALLASAPSPARADGTWMKVRVPTPPTGAEPGTPSLPEPVLADLARYATQVATLDADAGTSLTEVQRRENEAIAAVRAQFAMESKGVQAARAEKLQAWASEPENRQAILRLAQAGGDPATLRAASPILVLRLVAAGHSEAAAQAAVKGLLQHPLSHATPGRQPVYDKTDPLRGAMGTVKQVQRDAEKTGH